MAPSGAAVSLRGLVAGLRSRANSFLLLREGHQLDGLLQGIAAEVTTDRLLPQFPTTVYGGRYPMRLSLWHLAKTVRSPLLLRRLRRRWAIDLLHLNETVLFPLALAAQTIGLPVVVHVRTVIDRNHTAVPILDSLARRRGVRFVAIDETTRESLPPNARALATVVPNPIEVGTTTAEEIARLRRTWGAAESDVLIGQVGSLHVEKGIWDVINVFDQILRSRPSARLVFVGDDSGVLTREVRDAIDRRGLSGRIVFAGYQDDLAAVYGALDIGLCYFGRHLKGLGRTVYECAAAGVPVVATLPREQIPSNSEWLFDPDDHQRQSQAIVRLIDAPGHRRQSASNIAREFQFCSSEQSASRMLTIYEELLNGTPPDDRRT